MKLHSFFHGTLTLELTEEEINATAKHIREVIAGL